MLSCTLWLDSSDQELHSEFEKQCSELRIERGENVFRQGDHCRGFVLLISGTIRVFSRAESGREMLLYRLNPGDSCVLTTSCLLGRGAYPAEAITESETVLELLPAALFHRALQSSERFRTKIFDQFGARLSDMIGRVEQLTSVPVEERLAERLLELKNGEEVFATHQQLADDIGTAREVISRQLKRWQRAGVVETQRGVIRIRNPQQLAS